MLLCWALAPLKFQCEESAQNLELSGRGQADPRRPPSPRAPHTYQNFNVSAELVELPRQRKFDVIKPPPRID